MPKDLDGFWKWVEERMEELEIPSYRELAKRAGVSHATINSLKNQLKPPSIETAEGLCLALRVSWLELWTRAGFIEEYSREKVALEGDQLTGLDAEIYYTLRDTGDDFKRAVLKTVKTWLVLYEELKNNNHL